MASVARKLGSPPATAFTAADQLGLQACAVEIDPTFCDVIRRRFEAYAATPETEHA